VIEGSETPAVRAEQALLGAILADEQARATTPDIGGPRLLDELARWVMPGDFLRPYHRQVWGAVQAVRRRRELATPEAVREELSRSPQLRAETAQDGLLLHQLVARTPVTSRAPLYGGMVVEASLHRDMYTEAVRLDQQAREGDPDRVIEAQARARARVGVLRGRWERVPDAVRAHLDRPVTFEAAQPTRAQVAEQARQLAGQVAQMQAKTAEQIRAAQRAGGPVRPADLGMLEILGELLRRVVSVVDYLANASLDSPRQAPTHGRAGLAPGQSLSGKWNAAFVSAETDALTRGEQTQAQPEQDASAVSPDRAALEGRLVGCLIADQRQIDELTLTGAEFTDPAAKALYAAVAEIHRCGGAVDELTVEWAAQRAGADLTEMSPELGQAINDGLVVGSAPVYAQQLAATATRDQATKAAEQLRQASADPRLPPSRMLAQAEAELADLPEPQVQHRDTTGSHHEPPQPAPRQAERPRPERQQPERRPERPERLEPRRVPEQHPYRHRRRQLDREPELELEP
jgi:replicative DNA helicase